MSTRAAARLAWALWATGLALSGGAFALIALTSSVPVPERFGFRGFTAIFGFAFSSVGVLIASRRPGNPIGWLFCLVGLLSHFQALADAYLVYALLAHPGALPGGAVMAWFPDWIWLPIVGTVTTFLLLLFPEGRLLSPRWRPVLWLSAAAIAWGSFVLAVAPGPLDNFSIVTNPFGIKAFARIAPSNSPWPLLPLVACIVISTSSLFIRWRHAAAVEREQLKWLTYAAALAGSVLIAGFFLLDRFPRIDIPVIITFTAIPAAVGIAILRYRLYDINLVINRTLVYVPLTALLAGVYVAGIGLAKALFSKLMGETSDAAVAFTTLAVVALFTPLKNSLQGLVDRLFKEAQGSTLGLKAFLQQVRTVVQVLDKEQVAGQLLDKLVVALDAEGGAISLENNGRNELHRTSGAWDGLAALTVPLEQNGVQLGVISIGPCRQKRSYSAQERELLQRSSVVLVKALALAR